MKKKKIAELQSIHDGIDSGSHFRELKDLNLELEDRITARTRELASANKELEDFAYSVSHDLLQYLRLGKKDVSLEPIPLDELLQQVVNQFTSRIQSEGAFDSIPENLPTVIGNHLMLAQVVTNLIENGLIYHKPNEPARIEITCQEEGDTVTLGFRDHGIGIPEEFQDRIFEIFKRLHAQDEYPGTGIGLAIVKKSMELMKGTMKLESQEGEGALFSITLPLGDSKKSETEG